MGKRKRDVSEFGDYLVQTIGEANMSKCAFYAAVGINKPYFYEILTGPAPPQDTLEKMLQVIEAELGYDKERRNRFYDLAAKSRQDIPTDIADLIKEHPESWESVRVKLTELFAAKG